MRWAKSVRLPLFPLSFINSDRAFPAPVNLRSTRQRTPDTGGVEPLALDDLRRLPPRTQITRHDCVEGWSCIGKWKGVPLANLIDEVGLSKMLTAVWKQAV